MLLFIKTTPSCWTTPAPPTGCCLWQKLIREPISVAPPQPTRAWPLMHKSCSSTVRHPPPPPPTKWCQGLFHHVDHSLCSISGSGMRPEVSGILEVSCSCPECPTRTHYMWYKMDQDNRPLKLPGNSQASIKPDGKGTYACVALWDSGRTLISKGHFCE